MDRTRQPLRRLRVPGSREGPEMSELRILRCVCALGLFAVLAAGCGSKDKADPNAAKQAAPKVVKRETEAAVAGAYHHDPTDKGDPLRAYIRREGTPDTEE